jgi:RHS repeat-associated protein
VVLGDSTAAGYARVLQQTHYYPFGMRMSEISTSLADTSNNYLYNGKELQDDFGLNWYDYGARFYDPALGRFTTVDPIADIFNYQSPFAYASNNPIKYIDFMGLGSTIGADELTDEQWIETSRPGADPNLAKQYREQNRQKEMFQQQLQNLVNANGNMLKNSGLSGYYTMVDGVIVQNHIYGFGDFFPSFEASNDDDLSYIEALKQAWNLKLIGKNFPDNISFETTISGAFVVGNSMHYSLNLLTRGNDAGFHLTSTSMDRIGAEFNIGIGINCSYFTRNPLFLTKETLNGPIKNVSGGFIWGGSGFFGYPDSNSKKPTWIGVGTGIGFTIGASYGRGTTSSGWF